MCCCLRRPHGRCTSDGPSTDSKRRTRDCVTYIEFILRCSMSKPCTSCTELSLLPLNGRHTAIVSGKEFCCRLQRPGILGAHVNLRAGEAGLP